MRKLMSLAASLVLTSLCVVLLAGCAAPKPIPVIYKVPMIVLPPDPVPDIKKLTSKSTPDQVMKAWVSTAIAYRGWNKTVRKQIESSNI